MPEITLFEISWGVFKWIHIGASTIWVGGSLFFALVIRPLEHNPTVAESARLMALRYRELIGVVILALLISGVYLMLTSIFTTRIGPLWILILVVKLSLVAWMVYIYWNQRRRDDIPQSPRWRNWASQLLGYDALLALGILVLLLSSFLGRATAG